MFLLPWVLRKPLVQFVFAKLGGGREGACPDLDVRKRQVMDMADALKVKTGRWPALLIIMSHPKTEGPTEWLRFDLMRRGIQVADALLEHEHPHAVYRTHPRCLLAIDPFALDTLSQAAAAFYAAWMNQIYLAYDRQPSTQGLLQRALFLRRTSYHHIGWRFLSLLRSDVPLLMAFGGGLPHNARLLYGAREFVHHLRPSVWRVSKRAAQIELLDILSTPEGGVWAAERGAIGPKQKIAIRTAMQRWGMDAPQAETALTELEAEFRLPVPYRKRLLRVLMKRLVARGKSLILLPVSHKEEPAGVFIGEPVAIADGEWDFRPFLVTLANIFDPPESK